jgi:prolyl oligopeptidase
MKTFARAASAVLLAAAAAPLGAQRLTYPVAHTVDLVDEYPGPGGTRVSDPYRWLEDTDSPETRQWIEAENALTERYISAIPERARIRERLAEVWNFPRWGTPLKRGGLYFYSQNSGLQNQSVLYVAPTLHARPRVLLDPNTLRADGTEALSAYAVSDDGRLLGYGVSSGGSDWQEFRVRDVATGRDLPDTLRWIKFSGMTWTKDGKGFFYARYEQPAANALRVAVHNQKVYYHRIGTPQSADALVFQQPEQPDYIYSSGVTEDGRYLVLSVSKGTDRRNGVYVMDLGAPLAPRVQGTVRHVLEPMDASYGVVGNDGPVFYLVTDKDAPRDRLVATNIAATPARLRTIVAEGPDAIGGVRRVGGKFVIQTLHDVVSQLRVVNANGVTERRIDLPGIGAVGGLSARNTDRELFYSFASFLAPSTVYRYDVATGRSAPVWPVRASGFDASRYVTEQVFYTSKDGTRVPMFVTHRRDLARDGSNPTLLYAYGGFNSATLPSFSPAVAVWLEMGGVYASANIRGGSEYGEAWHQGGMQTHKQNVFDDFIAAGEYLVAQRWTQPSKLAIQGASNGGLLVGAVLNQRPDLFGAALPAVGVMDMLRFNKFTIGWAWTSDYGSPQDPAMFRTIYAYSPLHNIRPGTRYPATLITTGDHDDRVVPGHSFKYAATLQAAQAGDAPVLIRIETRAGHGAGKPTSMQIDEAADRWAFLVRSLGFTPRW